ncbi:MAG: crossover junction endodeoxyribonuclease RuvC [Polyangiaceae bacterium]
MLVLGIDPGTRHLGWGIVQRTGNRLTAIAHGVISPEPSLSLSERLVVIEHGLVDVIDRFRPDSAAVESLFFHKDAQAAAKLGHARGVVLLVLARASISIAEYAPAKVKRIIAGGGAAEKRQVALMMKALLGLSELPRADATDALALAVTHLRLGPLAKLQASTTSASTTSLHKGPSPRERLRKLAALARERRKG